jgi:hypothetical protein
MTFGRTVEIRWPFNFLREASGKVRRRFLQCEQILNARSMNAHQLARTKLKSSVGLRLDWVNGLGE